MGERVRVKVCGVTDPDNARLAVELGADYLGLNFYPQSPRFVSIEAAREIADAVRGRAGLVGVFVNRPPEEIPEIPEIIERVGLDLLQWSGDEGPDGVAPFAGRSIKVFRTGGPPGEAALAAYPGLWGLLFDAPHASLYGGTGAGWSYEGIAGLAGELAGISSGPRVFLAGGLGPDNVRRAVSLVRPFAVDVCSRVESAPGIKDAELLRRLFEEVRHADLSPAP